MIQKNKSVKSFIFDGIESLTDIVFYILYKFYKNHSIWNNLESIGIDTCRYITDFGIELLSNATQKTKLVKNLNGCNRIFKYLNDDVRLDHTTNDLFLSKQFNKLNVKDSEAVKLNSYKIIILNDSNILLLNQFFSKSESNSITNTLINYGQKKLIRKSSNEDITLNLFEINSVKYSKFIFYSSLICFFFLNINFDHIFKNFPLWLNTHSSIIILCIEYLDLKSLVNKIANRFLQLFNKV